MPDTSYKTQKGQTGMAELYENREQAERVIPVSYTHLTLPTIA